MNLPFIKLPIGYPRAARLKEQLDTVLEQESTGEHINEESMEIDEEEE